MFCVLDIYKRNVQITHKTTLFSKATFFVFITGFFAIIIPFLIAYRSRGFWLKQDRFHEQPNVRFRGEYYFIALTNNISNIIVCNNMAYFPELTHFDKCSTIKVREVDKNFDGIVDTLQYEMEIDYISDWHNFVEHFSLVLPLDYRLNTMCPVRMQSAIILQQFTVPKSNELHLHANLKLQQTSPLNCYTKHTEKLYNYPVIDNVQIADNFHPENIIKNYVKRKLTTHLTEIYATNSFKSSKLQNFHLKLHVDIIEDEIKYRPGLWQILKWAWIQYFAIYVIFAYLIRKLQNYVFDNNLVLTYKTVPGESLLKIFNQKKCF